MVPGANQTRMELLRRLNKMSSMVLDQTTQKTRAPANKGDVISKVGLYAHLRSAYMCSSFLSKQEILLDDLSGESTERGIELRVPDQTRYFPSQADGDGDATGLAPVSTDDISAFIDRSRNLGATTENVYFDSDVCLEVVDRLTRILDRGDRSGSRHHVSRDITSLHLGVNEALRHFWGAFPPKTAKQREKLSRVEQVLRTQIEQMKGHGSAGAAFKYDLDAAETALRALEYMTS